jgi:hypothetical protein
MATDMKLGMVLGVGVVLAVAVVYFPKAGRPDRASAVVPSLPAAAAAPDNALLPPVESRLRLRGAR